MQRSSPKTVEPSQREDVSVEDTPPSKKQKLSESPGEVGAATLEAIKEEGKVEDTEMAECAASQEEQEEERKKEKAKKDKSEKKKNKKATGIVVKYFPPVP